MAQLVVNIPDDIANRVINAFARIHGWSGTDPNGVPETKTQFAKRIVIQFIKDSVKKSEMNDAQLAAQATVEQSINDDIVLS